MALFRPLSQKLLKTKANFIFQILQRFSERCPNNLFEVLCDKIPKERKKVIEFRKKYGKATLGEVTVNLAYGGMRDLICLVSDISHLDNDKGILFRGYTIPECEKLLPKASNGCEPLPEGMFWLLCTGDIPNNDQAKSISKEWALRSTVPAYVIKMLDNFPRQLHPMAQFSCALTALSMQSKFAKAYNDGAKKIDYWISAYEDSMDCIAKLTTIAAIIYNNCFRCGKTEVCIDNDKDWSANFTKMLGYNNEQFTELMRLYLSLHTDHGSGNVSAHATHLVGSALSDPYLSLAAGINGLAGPLHGLANQEVLKFIKNLNKKYKDNPNEKQIEEFVNDTLKSGRVIPGYGHAVLRITDPRYTCQREFALHNLPDDKLFKTVSTLYKIVPNILKKLGKVKNPYPNVDAHSGVLLTHYGMTEMNFYTVLFGVSRALGVLSNFIWSRALGFPIERPLSLPRYILEEMVSKSIKNKCK